MADILTEKVHMGRRLLAMSGVWLLACAVVAAADFWEEKEFTAWSDRNVEKMGLSGFPNDICVMQ